MKMMVLWLIFIGATGGLAFVSRKYLAKPGTHGFWRFLAFEAVIGLVLVNTGHWFREPFRAVQWVSWAALVLSAFLPLYGLLTLKNRGLARGHFENTRKLVTTGLYRYIRHPMYASLFYLAWGAFLKDVSVTSSIILALAMAFLLVLAKVEEREMVAKFGPSYAAYMRATRRFIPFLF